MLNNSVIAIILAFFFVDNGNIAIFLDVSLKSI